MPAPPLPSIDVLFESAADAYGSRLAGVLPLGLTRTDRRDAQIQALGGVTLGKTRTAEEGRCRMAIEAGWQHIPLLEAAFLVKYQREGG
jgi:chemotaxis response regulator CheB